jgi:FkbM family methyltransferase
MKCDVLHYPNGWSDVTFHAALGSAIGHCRRSGLKLDVALDIGCKGTSIGELIKQCDPKRVYGFEPTPKSYRKVLARYSADARVTVLQAAVSNRDGVFPFFITPDNRAEAAAPPASLPANGSPSTPAMRGSGNAGNSFVPDPARIAIGVDTVRLDTWAQTSGVVTFDIVKLDVEGHEIEAIEGMGHYIETVNILISEVQFTSHRPTSYHHLAALLDKHGLEVFSIAGLSYYGERLFWADVVFARVR